MCGNSGYVPKILQIDELRPQQRLFFENRKDFQECGLTSGAWIKKNNSSQSINLAFQGSFARIFRGCVSFNINWEIQPLALVTAALQSNSQSAFSHLHILEWDDGKAAKSSKDKGTKIMAIHPSANRLSKTTMFDQMFGLTGYAKYLLLVVTDRSLPCRPAYRSCAGWRSPGRCPGWHSPGYRYESSRRDTGRKS